MKDEFGFSDGDVLVIRNWILIYAGCKRSDFGNRILHAIMYHALMKIDGDHLTSVNINGPSPGIGYIEHNPKPRYATNTEINNFLNFIESSNHNVKWDFKDKKFKSLKTHEYVC